MLSDAEQWLLVNTKFGALKHILSLSLMPQINHDIDRIYSIDDQARALKADEAQGPQDMLQGLDVSILAHLLRQA